MLSQKQMNSVLYSYTVILCISCQINQQNIACVLLISFLKFLTPFDWYYWEWEHFIFTVYMNILKPELISLKKQLILTTIISVHFHAINQAFNQIIFRCELTNLTLNFNLSKSLNCYQFFPQFYFASKVILTSTLCSKRLEKAGQGCHNTEAWNWFDYGRWSCHWMFAWWADLHW